MPKISDLLKIIENKNAKLAVQKRIGVRPRFSLLLDHFVSPHHDNRRDGQVDGLRGAKVQHKGIDAWLLDRKIGWVGAFEDLIHVSRSMT